MTDETAPTPIIKLKRLEFREYGYPGYEADTRINCPLRVGKAWQEALRSGNEALSRAAVLEMYPWWNFIDDTGAPIPHTVKGFDLMPDDLLTAMLKERQKALAGETQNPLGPTSSAGPNRQQRRAAAQKSAKSGQS